jgi:hypothetical protein
LVNDTYCPNITDKTPIFVDFGGEGELPSYDLEYKYSVSYFAE